MAKETEKDAEVVDQAGIASTGDTKGASNTNLAMVVAAGLVVLIVIVMLSSGGDGPADVAGGSAVPSMGSSVANAAETVSNAGMPGGIERKGEGRHFYTTIKIPAGAETLYLSGSGASRKEDGSMGSMEEQTRSTFSSFQETLEAEGWSMSDIVQVRAFAVAGEYGELDFDGFNIAYREFFGSEENPMKPVRSFVEIAGLVVPGWLVEIEIRAARMP